MTDAFDVGWVLTVATVLALVLGEGGAAVLFAIGAGVAAVADVYIRWEWG